MAKKISELDLVTTLGSSDMVPVVQAGATKRAPVSLWPVGGGSGGGGGVSAAERIIYLSKSGNDSNDGLSWKTAVLTMAKASQLLSYYYGEIRVGFGVFDAQNLTLQGTQRIVGLSRHGSYLNLPSSGVLLNLDNQSNPGLYNIGLQFASASVTGTLVKMANAFTCTFVDVGFDGVQTGNAGTAGQIGVSLTANAGDSHFIGCEFQLLDIGIDNQTTVNYVTDCNFTSCKSAGIRGGVPAGGTWASGIVVQSCTFRGYGDYYVDCNGTAQGWVVDGCFFDGQATTAVRVGQGDKGPWMFQLINTPFLSGALVNLELNAANVFEFTGIMGDSYFNGQHPNELVVGNFANLPKGKFGPYLDLQGKDLGARLPATGWVKI